MKYGIEIEAYNVEIHKIRQALQEAGIIGWKVVYDGSISGPKSFEVVSPVLNEETGFDQIKKVMEILDHLGAKVNKSCGFHVHHDAAKYKSRHFKNLFILYRRAEKTIDSFMPPSRRENKNTYCKSLQNLSVEGPESRYYKLNLTAFHKHGTVEFRHHSGTIDPEKIINWVLFTGRMVDHARSSKFRVKDISKSLSWGLLKVTLGFSCQIKKGSVEALQITRYFEKRMGEV